MRTSVVPNSPFSIVGLLFKWTISLILILIAIFANNFVFGNFSFSFDSIIDIVLVFILFELLILIFILLKLNHFRAIYILCLITYLFLTSSFLLYKNNDLLSILTLSIIYSIAFILSIASRNSLSFLLQLIFISITVSGLVGLETDFSDEEFVLLAQGLLSTWIWIILFVAHYLIFRFKYDKSESKLYNILTLIYIVFLSFFVVRRYQESFYVSYQHDKFYVNSELPFICELGPNKGEEFYSNTVFNELIDLVLRNSNKQSPEYGMLALATGERRWGDSFRVALLSEAHDNLFTNPVGSIKFYQYFAALRVYFYSEVIKKFPNLFDDSDKKIIQDWFSRINARTHTVEWVDWLYAVSTGSWPQGPYHNQEVGAGLLALLERGKFATPELSSANLYYLNNHLGGWSASFRVTDDTLLYQREWITNAFFQDLYRPSAPNRNKALSFEWLKLQALPNGDVVSYNLPREYRFSLAPLFYLGAQLTGDSELVWLAGKSAEWAKQQGIPVFAQPGAEQPPSILINGLAPRVRSCLMFGDSGLATRRVPLVPDKVVLRDGWDEDSVVVLVNLRFSGWHRYKATGAILGVFHRDLAVADRLDSVQRWGVLPAGRSLVRDKRIPREAVNGVTLLDRGMTKLARVFSGIGSPWAQDPPHYAEIESFRTGDDFDAVQLRIRWDETLWERQLSLNHAQRKLVVVDRVNSPWKRPFLLNWHVLDKNNVKYEDSYFVINECIQMSINFSNKDYVKIYKELYDKSITLSLYSEDNNTITTTFSFICDS